MKKIRGYELIHGITGQIFATNEGTATTDARAFPPWIKANSMKKQTVEICIRCKEGDEEVAAQRVAELIAEGYTCGQEPSWEILPYKE